jgi:hypothetical protein
MFGILSSFFSEMESLNEMKQGAIARWASCPLFNSSSQNQLRIQVHSIAESVTSLAGDKSVSLRSSQAKSGKSQITVDCITHQALESAPILRMQKTHGLISQFSLG